MNSKPILGVMPFLILSVAGCGSSPLPPADQVAGVRLSVMRMPEEAKHADKPLVANLNAKADIAEMMDYLGTIDWSQRGTDMAVIGIPQADGGIVVTTKAGDTREYGFYWDGKFTLIKANRLIRGGDTDKLKKLVQRVCK